jgi:hypothetical protein
MSMFAHLETYSPDVFDAATPAPKPAQTYAVEEILEAKIQTTAFHEGLVSESADTSEEQAVATAFATITDPNAPEESRKISLNALRTPESVKHMVAMLTAYQWKFVHHAEEIRSYVVTKLLEESKHKEARIRLKALEMLGKVTEVALFTDRVEVKKTSMSDEELEKEVRERLKRLTLVNSEDIQDVSEILPVESAEITHRLTSPGADTPIDA